MSYQSHAQNMKQVCQSKKLHVHLAWVQTPSELYRYLQWKIKKIKYLLLAGKSIKSQNPLNLNNRGDKRNESSQGTWVTKGNKRDEGSQGVGVTEQFGGPNFASFKPSFKIPQVVFLP